MCPMLEEIAKEFFPAPLSDHFVSCSTYGDFREARMLAINYALEMFTQRYTSRRNVLQSFLLYNIAHYLDTRRPVNNRYLDRICIDLHGLPARYVGEFALKTLKIVEKLQAQPETKEKYNRHREVHFIPGWGSHTKEGADTLLNKEIVKTILANIGYQVYDTEKNKGMIYVVLGNYPLQYVPPIEKPQRPVGLPDAWKSKRQLDMERKRITRTTSLPSTFEVQETQTNTVRKLQKYSTVPQLSPVVGNESEREQRDSELQGEEETEDDSTVQFTLVQRRSSKRGTIWKSKLNKS